MTHWCSKCISGSEADVNKGPVEFRTSVSKSGGHSNLKFGHRLNKTPPVAQFTRGLYNLPERGPRGRPVSKTIGWAG